jgi:hypothetical protein
MIRAWNAAPHLDDQTFHEIFVGNDAVDLAATQQLREAFRKSVPAQTINQMIVASAPLRTLLGITATVRMPDMPGSSGL